MLKDYIPCHSICPPLSEKETNAVLSSHYSCLNCCVCVARAEQEQRLEHYCKGWRGEGMYITWSLLIANNRKQYWLTMSRAIYYLCIQMYKLGLEKQRNQRSNCQQALYHAESKGIPEKHLLVSLTVLNVLTV